MSFSSVSTDIKAFVRFNGTTNFGGDCSIDSARNVSSVLDNGTGDYTVNFTTALADANYCATVMSGTTSLTNSGGLTFAGQGSATPTTTAFRFRVRGDDGSPVDSAFIGIAFYR